METLKLGIIGAGTVGTALAVRLSRKGYRIAAVASRSLSSARRLVQAVGSGQVYDTPQGVAENASFIFLTTPDDAIPAIVNQVRWHRGQCVVHCSGADSLDVLEPARIVGAHVGSFHPLQTFASIQKAIDNLPGSTFALEAEGPLLNTLKEMAGALEGRWIKLEAGDKAAYHTAAVMTCNYLVTLVKLATDLWDSFGVPRQQAIQALLPLLKGTLNNIENLSVPQALTGPIARGDVGTVQIHLNTLKDNAPSILPAYCELGLQTIPLAIAKGKLGQDQAKELEELLRQSLKSIVERDEKCVPC
ncbi:MAG: pyrroline-5-carboxylate reductase [Chloroflexi bacterium]|nr:pyrroline-5-carboxylate reductase [Chloroflexota bacterium]